MLQAAAEEEQERLKRYKRAWEAYHGRLPDPLKVRGGKPNDNLKVNYARLVIDLGVTFLFGRDVRFELAEGQATPAEDWLGQVWKRNRKLTWLQKLAMNGGVCGTVFVKIVPGPRFPRLINLDPAMVKPTYEDEDIDRVTSWTLSWIAITNGEPMQRRQRIDRVSDAAWIIVDEQKPFSNERWVEIGRQDWPYSWAPVHHAQNLPAANEFFGIADLEDDLIGLNKGMNFLLSNMNRIIRFHAHPKTWGKGFKAAELQVAIDETIVLPNKDAELGNLEMQGDLSSSIELYKEIKDALQGIARTPAIAAGKVEQLGQLSGLALKVLYGPLVGKTETKQQTYGDLLVELNEHLLELGGHGAELETTLHWPEMVPSDELQQRNMLIIDKQLGASQDTVLQKAGYDPDVEREKRRIDAEQAGSSLLSAFDRGATDPAAPAPARGGAQ